MGDHYFYSLEGPLDTMPVERQMRTANLCGFTGLIRGLGTDPRSILEEHGIDPLAILDPDSYIDSKSLVDVLEHCSTSFNDPLFGLRLAQQQEADVYGCIAPLCRAASTVREALNSFVTYIPVTHSPVSVLELAEDRDIAELRWHVGTDLGQNNQANYQAALLNLKLLRLVAGRNFVPSHISLQVDARARDIAEIEKRLGCSFRSRASVSAIAFPARVLDQSVASSNRLLFRLLGSYLDKVRTASRKTLMERVEDYVRGALPLGNCSIERCAKKMGTSVRTLQANLSDSGLRFSEILEKQRTELVKVYLAQAELSLDDIAALLGYTDQSSFGRAFKRWTGVTPQKYRRDCEVPKAA